MEDPRSVACEPFVARSLTTQATGNLGGENYDDKDRSIINTGGLYAERRGFHLEGTDDTRWETRSIADGIPQPGVGFFRTTFDLNLPADFDVPIRWVRMYTPGCAR